MPIAPIDGCTTEHWIDVKRIITESLADITDYDTNPKIVSEGDSTGLIHKRIVEGLYTSEIVICDVSCKNPNVMFELGMRLAFDRPTVIIKDDKTDYSFDTGVIEHLNYPRDLRYNEIVEFKERLAEKVKSTYEESIKDSNYSPFLKSFGTFRVSSLKEDEVTPNEFIIRTLQDIQVEINELKTSNLRKGNQNYDSNPFKKRVSSLTSSRMFDAMLEVIDNLILEDTFVNLSTNELIPIVKNELNKMGFMAKDHEIRAALKNILDEYGNKILKDA